MRAGWIETRRALAGLCLVLACATARAQQTDAPLPLPASPTAESDPRFAFHAQSTVIVQGNLPFDARFSGPNSFDKRGETRETFDFTAYIGARLWEGAEAWINPEVDQGFGLRNTLGAAGFPSGEAYKVGKKYPYVKLHRLFVRQTIALGGPAAPVDADLNLFAAKRARDRLVFTAGKFAVGDVFDVNTYAHDARGDFLNWTVIDVGTFDYAANSWGYSAGASAELYVHRYAVRAGFFDLSKVPNGEALEEGFRQYEGVGELEERHSIRGRAGRITINGWFNHGSMGRFDDAIALAGVAGGPVDVARVRRFATRAGASVNVEQAVTTTLGVFARAGFADGRYETFEFTDVDRALSLGASLAGKGWGRPTDRVGLAFALNQATDARKRYLAAGGLGILIGDGALPHSGYETVVESYYRLALGTRAHVSFDAQLIDNPGYNRDRGPVVVLAGRLQGQF